MWQYIYTDELYHYGVPGMKWGVRRTEAKLNRLNGRIKKLREKRSDVLKKKGASSRSYRRLSKDIYITKSKRDIVKAKRDNNVEDLMVAKARLKEGRFMKKEGTGIYYTNDAVRPVYGHHLTVNQMSAISLSEIRDAQIRQVGKVVGTAALATIGALTAREVLKKYKIDLVW
jgi:hypothetical protein